MSVHRNDVSYRRYINRIIWSNEISDEMQLCLCIIAKIFHPVGWMINELAYSLPYTHPFNSASVSRWCVCCAHVLAQMLAFDLEKSTCRVDDKLNGEQMIYERFKLSISWHEYLYRYYSNFLFAHFVRYTMIEPNSLSNKNTILTYLIYQIFLQIPNT